MKHGSALRGLFGHAWLTLRLNFRSLQALSYGYLVPVFFLLAFGSVFRSDTPPLLHQMGQLLTITILGGACFGLPTGLVAERERGVWRRYRLLPVSSGGLVAGTIAARIVIVAGAVVLQVALARWIYGTPWPSHPLAGIAAYLVVAWAFLGLGLLIAALADDVPAVQALGQCLFLPMIMIGGVGVPLAALPAWAQRLAGFMPGRYAVDVLQRCVADPRGLAGAGFSLGALLVIGAAGGLVGTKLFRWDAGRRVGRRGLAWSGVALGAWLAVGLAAAGTGRLEPVLPGTAYEQITPEQVDAITYDDLPEDNELVTRMSPPFARGHEPAFVLGFREKLAAWPPGHVDDAGQRVRNLLSVAAVADICADLHEAEIGRMVYDQLRIAVGDARLRLVLAWVILRPDDGQVLAGIPELNLKRRPAERVVRERSTLYAKKYLGRLLGKLHD
ncbi:MAG TPA: ABC transporter permease [Lacunisphaera sp.]|jgi:ABC-2 type transport system permease protein|nr:ABC transporter permease [Lacunisphaera sp.]